MHTHTISKETQKGFNLNSEVRHGIKNRERENKSYSTYNATKTDRDSGEDKGLNTRG